MGAGVGSVEGVYGCRCGKCGGGIWVQVWEVWRGYMGAGVGMKERGEHSDTYT